DTSLRISALLRCINRNEMFNNVNNLNTGDNENNDSEILSTVQTRNDITNSNNDQNPSIALDLSLTTQFDTAAPEQPSTTITSGSVVDSLPSLNSYNVYRNYDSSTRYNNSQEQRQQSREHRHSHGHHHRHRHSKHRQPSPSSNSGNVAHSEDNSSMNTHEWTVVKNPK
ncbi:unnamed protein product, partial [Didymodactylos carnosus]